MTPSNPLVRQSAPRWAVLEGDCRAQLATLDAGSVQTCVTSPPYFGLRDYGHDGQIGLEPTPDEFVAALADVFRAVRRVLRDDGTVWLNLGDSYKEKELLGIPWMVAFALRADGWYLRSDIIWAKTSCMPEPVKDRPTRAHEYIFLFSKSSRYFYDAEAVREEALQPVGEPRASGGKKAAELVGTVPAHRNGQGKSILGSNQGAPYRNRRSVWHVATYPFPGAHFATFPPKLIEPCILAGSAPGDTVLDPFSGSGTTGMVALRHGRSYVGCELNPDYVALSRDRIVDDAPLLNQIAEAA